MPPNTLRAAVDAAEREVLLQALLATGGQVEEAARVLDCSRATIYRLLNKFGLHTKRIVVAVAPAEAPPEESP